MDDNTRELIEAYAHSVLHRVDDAIVNSKGKDRATAAFIIPDMSVDRSNYGEVRSIILNVANSNAFLGLIKVINIDTEWAPVTDAYNDLDPETPEEVEGFIKVIITARAASEY